MVLPIITEPDPVLRQPAAPIEHIDENVKRLARDMIETMHRARGVGLAAPQVHQGIRLIVVWSPEDQKVTPMVNPILTKKSFRKYIDQEGCLSIPGVWGKVKRHRSVTVEFVDLEDKKQMIQAEMLHARIIQHEIDHLEGILFTDKVIGALSKTKVL